MTRLKRPMALLLCLCMVLGMMPNAQSRNRQNDTNPSLRYAVEAIM